MTALRRVIVLAAAVSLLVLLWKVDAAQVWAHLRQVGWGLGLIVAQEIVAHACNALGWRLAFPPDSAGAYRFWELLRLRVAGDGVNYLTPSGTIAGEVLRGVLLQGPHGAELRYASVAVAKLTQSLAQMLFVLLGLLCLTLGPSPLLRGHQGALRAAAGVLSAALAALALACLWVYKRLDPERRQAAAPGWRGALGALPRQCLFYLRDHPGRFAASSACFMLGYAWGGFEAYWICRFLGLPVSVGSALAIEVLSNLIDGLFFMVPAKIGTQEAGKTAIFVALGMPASAGFAFGVLRHVRELSWSGLGLLLSLDKLNPRRPPPPARSLPVPGAAAGAG